MKKLRWSIVSAGRISAQFCHDMQFVKNGELAAVATRRLTSDQHFTKKHHIEKYYEGYQAMFNDPDIVAVYIGTPHT